MQHGKDSLRTTRSSGSSENHLVRRLSLRTPEPRGPLSEMLLARLNGAPRRLWSGAIPHDDPLSGDDFQLALYVCYELHYRGVDGVDEEWEWEPSLLALRRRLELI